MFRSSVLLDCYFCAGIKQDLTGFIILLSNQSAVSLINYTIIPSA